MTGFLLPVFDPSLLLFLSTKRLEVKSQIQENQPDLLAKPPRKRWLLISSPGEAKAIRRRIPHGRRWRAESKTIPER
jgi:hypothetical protein